MDFILIPFHDQLAKSLEIINKGRGEGSGESGWMEAGLRSGVGKEYGREKRWGRMGQKGNGKNLW